MLWSAGLFVISIYFLIGVYGVCLLCMTFVVVIVWLIVLRSLVLLVFDSDSVCGWSCRCVVLNLR